MAGLRSKYMTEKLILDTIVQANGWSKELPRIAYINPVRYFSSFQLAG